MCDLGSSWRFDLFFGMEDIVQLPFVSNGLDGPWARNGVNKGCQEPFPKILVQFPLIIYKIDEVKSERVPGTFIYRKRYLTPLFTRWSNCECD